MNELIQIKCPWCGAVLSVRNVPGIEGKGVTCPVCKQKSPFVQCKRVMPRNTVEKTDYPRGERTEYRSDERTRLPEKTEVREQENLTIGSLILTPGGKKFHLSPGRNVIGRKAQASTADIMIDTGEGRRMSRKHIVIEVKRVPGKGFVHYISLYKEQCNPTFLGNDPIEYGDTIVLAHGDTITMPDAVLKFEIADGEGTEY